MQIIKKILRGEGETQHIATTSVVNQFIDELLSADNNFELVDREGSTNSAWACIKWKNHDKYLKIEKRSSGSSANVRMYINIVTSISESPTGGYFSINISAVDTYASAIGFIFYKGIDTFCFLLRSGENYPTPQSITKEYYLFMAERFDNPSIKMEAMLERSTTLRAHTKGYTSYLNISENQNQVNVDTSIGVNKMNKLICGTPTNLLCEKLFNFTNLESAALLDIVTINNERYLLFDSSNNYLMKLD